MGIGTWNVNSFTNKVFEAVSAVTECSMDILDLSETKKKGNGSQLLVGYLHCWSGVDKYQRTQADVSILVKKHIRKYNEDYEKISERIIIMTLRFFGL